MTHKLVADVELTKPTQFVGLSWWKVDWTDREPSNKEKSFNRLLGTKPKKDFQSARKHIQTNSNENGKKDCIDNIQMAMLTTVW